MQNQPLKVIEGVSMNHQRYYGGGSLHLRGAVLRMPYEHVNKSIHVFHPYSGGAPIECEPPAGGWCIQVRKNRFH